MQSAHSSQHRRHVVAVVVLLACLCGAVHAEPSASADAVVANLLERDFMWYGDEALHYAEAAAVVGALRHAQATGNGEMRQALITRYRPLLDPSNGLVSHREHVDMAVIGIVPLEIAMQTGDAQFLALGIELADRQWHDPRPDGLTRQTRWWIDDLYMVGMLQMQAWRATGDPAYADRAAAQLAAYLPRMQHESGLFYHSPDAPIFWGRGNGWVAAAMAEVLRDLPPEHPQAGAIRDAYVNMMLALREYQADNGMWRQVVDYEYAWAESSATAMFAYAMKIGTEHGLLDAAVYNPVVERAWAALEAHLDRDGNVREVCVGTGKENDLEYYLARPRVTGDLHGQAPFLWLATALEKR